MPKRRSKHEVPVYEVRLLRSGSRRILRPRCAAPRDVVDLFRIHIGDPDREHFVAFFLNAQNRFIGIHTVSIGTVNTSVVHPREVFKAAILRNAVSLVLAHNHPSGDPTPSAEDIAVTRGLYFCGNLLGIHVVDHVVVGVEDYASFVELSLMVDSDPGETDGSDDIIREGGWTSS